MRWWWVNYLRQADCRRLTAGLLNEDRYPFVPTTMKYILVQPFPQDLYPREDDLPRHSAEIPIFPNLPFNPRR